MKRFLLLFTCIIFLIFASSSVAFADNYITQQDIDEGMEFCEQYPVKLTLDGEEIIFEEDDIPPLIIKERTLIPARALFESMGGTVDWDEEKQEVKITLEDSLVVLTIGSNLAWVDETARTLEVPAMIIARKGEVYGRTMIPVRFTAESLGCDVDWNDPEREVVIFSPEVKEDEATEEPDGDLPSGYQPLGRMNEIAAQKLIFIDVGHGGGDPGASGNKGKPNELYEKTVNLEVGLYVRDYLREAGANIYMVRETDTYFAPTERPEIANTIDAQLYVSIHNNSSDFDWPTGTEVHYYSKVDEEGRDEKELYGIYSEDVAERVQKEMLKALGTFDRGVKNSPKLIVLNRTVMPAIVIEGAFLSNAEDLLLIRSEDYAKRYAYATAKALIEIMNETYK